jgi:pimeloyl-ACP methyl ester carboxylesterase
MRMGFGASAGFVPALLAVASLLGSPPAVAQGLCHLSTCDADETQASGAIYRICMPEPGCWNGDLVVWAHGYVAPNEPLAIPEDQLTFPDGSSLPGLANALGFGFATTSYPRNGLAIKDGVEDVRGLVGAFGTRKGSPNRVYLVGASEGGAVTALAVERFPDVFAGGLAACGPIGDFHRQIDYLGNFRVVFDYFFPGLIPGSAIQVPDEVMTNWTSIYEPLIRSALRARPGATDQLLRVTRAPFDPLDPATREETALGLLWYAVFSTNDGIARLGGQPFDNTLRFYTGSSNDFLLNLLVKRHRADVRALGEIQANYQTSGRLEAPLVTLHTTGDPIIPYGHEPLYTFKAFVSGSGLLHANLPVLRYGHCRFQASEALIGFALLVLMAQGRELQAVEALLPDEASREVLHQLVRKPVPASPGP